MVKLLFGVVVLAGLWSSSASQTGTCDNRGSDTVCSVQAVANCPPCPPCPDCPPCEKCP